MTVYIETKQNYYTWAHDHIGFNNIHGYDHIGFNKYANLHCKG